MSSDSGAKSQSTTPGHLAGEVLPRPVSTQTSAEVGTARQVPSQQASKPAGRQSVVGLDWRLSGRRYGWLSKEGGGVGVKSGYFRPGSAHSEKPPKAQRVRCARPHKDSVGFWGCVVDRSPRLAGAGSVA